jgi:hypothetical protein
MKNGSKRRAWTSAEVRELKTMARRKTPAGRIGRKLKRTEGAPKSVQYGIVTRLALTTRSLKDFLTTKPRLARGFFSIVVCTPAYDSHSQDS